MAGNNLVSRCMRRVEKSYPRRDTKDDQGPPSVAALPHRHGLRPGELARAPLSSKCDGRRPTRERGRPARMQSRCVPLSFPAMRRPATLPEGTPWARPKQSPGPAAGRSEWSEWARLCQRCAGGTPALPDGLHPMTSSQQSRSIGLRVYSWFVFNNDRQFLPPMIRQAGQGRHLQETPGEATVVRDRSAGNSSRARCDRGIAGSPIH